MDFSNFTVPNITWPTTADLGNLVDKYTSIGQCVARSTESIDILRCDQALSNLPTKHDPFSLCYQVFNGGLRVLEGSFYRIHKQIYSTELFNKVINASIELSGQCIEHRRNCTLLFEGTNETALKAFECLKPHFGNMFRYSDDSPLRNLCRIALNKFGEVRGVLEIDLFSRGEAFFNRECFQLEPISFLREGYSFEQYVSDDHLFFGKILCTVIGFSLAGLVHSLVLRRQKPIRAATMLSSGALAAGLIYSGTWRLNDFCLGQAILTTSTSFVANSVFWALYNLK